MSLKFFVKTPRHRPRFLESVGRLTADGMTVIKESLKILWRCQLRKPSFLQDNHEICFVGAEGFDDLSQVDPKGDALLEEALEADKSKEWYEKKKRSKDEAK